MRQLNGFRQALRKFGMVHLIGIMAPDRAEQQMFAKQKPC
jgi:hypothetical protein